MRILSVLLIFLVLLPLGALASDAPTLFVASDLHYISPTLTDHGEYFTRMIENGDGKLVHYAEELTDAFVQEVIAQQPDCLILSGDLTFNGAKKSHEDLAAKLRLIDESGVPVYVLPGNHDVYCYAAASFSGDGYALAEGTTSEDFAAIYHDLGFDEALSRDPYSLSYIAEPAPGVRVLMLDVNTQFMPGAVAQNTFSWLEKVLAKAQEDGAKVIAVSHQNLYAHSSLLYEGYVIPNAAMLHSRYEKYGVAVNLSGHLHMQHTITGEGKTPEIATSALSVSPCQYGVIEIGEDQASYRTQSVDVSAWAAANGKTDANLLNFRQYAAGFFAVTAISQAAAQLEGESDPSAMATWLANLNSAYFSGRMDTVDPTSEYALRWQQSDTFFGQYVKSILSEPLANHTQLTFPL
ncbi:MAG: metallophosphoesterase [Clostridia bacterium]|nr:metallophosphoesterase [Clostridia bacterium]